MSKQNVLDNERIGRLLVKLTIPAFWSGIVLTLYNIVDTIFIGQFVGTLGIAGLTIVFPLQMLSGAIGSMTGMGGASIISRAIGAKNIPRAENALGNAVSINILISLIITVSALLNLESLIRFLGSSETVEPFARDYITIILFGFVFQALSMSISFLIRAEGNVKIPMIGMIGSAILNIILDALFIIPLNMGIQGAALATILSQFICVLFYYLYYFSGRSYLKFSPLNMRFKWKMVGEILSIGIASFAMLSAVSLSSVLINRMLVNYGGDIALSAYGVIHRIMMIMLIPGISFGQGLQPILGYNLGAQRYDRAIKVIKLALIYATICGVIVFLLMFFMPQPFVRMFTSDPELIELSAYAAKRVFFLAYFIGIIFIVPTIFQSIGKPIQSFITSIARSVLFLIPTILIFPRLLGIDGVWIAFPVTDFLTVLLNAAFLLPQIREFQKAKFLKVGLSTH